MRMCMDIINMLSEKNGHIHDTGRLYIKIKKEYEKMKNNENMKFQNIIFFTLSITHVYIVMTEYHILEKEHVLERYRYDLSIVTINAQVCLQSHILDNSVCSYANHIP